MRTTPEAEPLAPATNPPDRWAAAAQLGLAPDVRELMLRVEARCDQRCLFCSVAALREPVVAAPARLAAAVLEAGAPPLVVLSGGEPLLSPTLPDQLAAVLAAGAQRVMIQTNGMRLARPELVAQLLPFRNEVFFLVSLHAHRPDISDLLTQRPGGFDRTAAGIERATAAGFTVWLNHVLTPLNVAEVEDFVEQVVARWPGVGLLVVSTVNPTHRAAAHPWLMPRLDAVGPPLRRALGRARALGLAVAVSEVCGVPVCVVDGFEDTHDTWRSRAAPPPGLPPDRTLAPFCPACRHHSYCLGVWRAYADRFGFVGLTPRA